MIQIIVNNKEQIDLLSSANLNLWLDDTASMVKQKLSSELKVSSEEMYLFLEATSSLSPQSVYSLLSRNRKFPVTVDILKGFVGNMRETRRWLNMIDELPKNDPVPYSFFETIFAEQIEYVVRVPFGLSFGLDPINTGMDVDNIILPTNPYDAKRILRNKFLVLSNNEETLLSKLPSVMKDPIIHVCTALETIQSHEHPSVGELVSLYFPKLAAKLPAKLGVNSSLVDYVEAIRAIRKDLLSQSDILFRSNMKYYKNIDFWNSNRIFAEKKNNEAVVGITSLRATYLSTPTITYPLPIEFIFKSIHATERMPFIRYVISKRREQMVRLYAPVEATDDKRIPFLPRSLVNKILVKSKKVPGVGAFFVTPLGGEDIYIFIELKETGDIQLHVETPDTKPITFMQFELLENVINDFVYTINQILKQTDIILVPIDNMVKNASISAVDWIISYPFFKPPTEVINQTKAKLGTSVFLADNIVSKEKGKKEKEKEPAKTKEKAAKLKTEMNFIYSRVSNFSVDIPEEIQTKLKVYYSVDTHQLYMKISNIPQLKYMMTIPMYVEHFMELLTNKDLEGEYKSAANMSTYGYNKQKGEEEFQLEMLEELKEKEAEAAEDAEEIDEFDKYIMERMQNIPEAPTEKEEQETEELLGEFELEEGEEEEEEELGDFDEDL
jgi:hypothetical protein